MDYFKVVNPIGAGSGGGQLLLWRYFGPPWTTFTPTQTFILGHNSQGKLVSGSKKRSKTGEDLFFFFF